MCEMTKMMDFKDTLIFESQKEFYDERGRGARYRMTTVGVSFFKREVGDLKDLPGLIQWLQDNEFCHRIQTEEDNLSLTLRVQGCCLRKITEQFIAKNGQPLSCPIANVIMHSLELNGSLPPEMIPVEFEGETCIVKMAKIFTSEVVK